ncbi:TetR/AcrR family transcriptional regulator [Saccharopolyspora rosea]|uniref:TetR/AcrR family transcriptional regulator n=1 Tax=Saccharopolyspora rosea TaxID=524884 RepID=A0ABW3FMX9_9PSEU|nr:TetR/AcrR family transcriptional regulator [Saccharopolyspora rosea]
MTSQCHSTPQCHSTRPAPNRVGEAELLAAARECVLADGLRRTTLAGVARRAGVSRMTLYRRFPDVDSLVTALITAEFTAILHRARDAAGDGSARERLVAGTVHAVRLLQSAPLLRRVLRTDAELLLPYLVERLGSTQLAAEGFLREHVAHGHADKSIRAGDPPVQARALLLMVQSFVVSAVPAAQDDPTALNDELARMLDAALAP